MTSIRNILSVGFAAFLVFYLSSCGCSEANCSDRLRVEFSRSWEEGYHELVVVADDVTIVCDFHLEKNNPDLYIPCGTPGGYGLEDGFRASYNPGRAVLSLGWAPEKVSVTIWYESESLDSHTFEPEYELESPNGESCGPTCHTATVSFPSAG